MADGYGDSGLMTNEPVLSLDEIIRRNRAIRARKDEIQRREDELRRLAEQQDASKLEDPGSVEGRQRHKEAMRKGPVYQAPTPKPTTVNVDGTDMPYDEAVSKIPDQMDFEQKLLSSPLAKLALRRRRIEDLVTDEGKSQEEAEQIALEEQQGRAAAFTLGQETIRNSPGYMPKEVRALGSGLTNSAIAMGARVFGLNQVADEAEATRAGISSEMSGIRDAQHPYPEVMGALSGAAESSIQMLPGMIASPVVGPTAGMAIMSGQFGTQEYSNAKYEGAEAGLSGDELNRYALIQGGVEASIMPIFSKIPGLAGLEGRVLQQNIARTMASNPKLRQAIAEGAFKLGKDVSAELAEEITTEVLHGFATEGGLNQKVNYPEVIKDTVLQTLVMMGSAQVGESIGSVASKGDLFGMRKPQSEATPVLPDQQPAEDTSSFTQIPIDEMIQRHDAAAGSQATIPPEVEAFTASPSRTKYEAAIKAGMPPITKPDGTPDIKPKEKDRKKYAADLLKDPFGMRKPDLSGSSPTPDPATQPAATPDPAALEPVSETNQETVPDNFYDEVLNLYLKKGDPNGQIQASKNADEAEGQQVQTKELLNDLPAGTQDPAPPVAVNESPTPAAHTREEFETVYRDTSAKLQAADPSQPEYQRYLEQMADLYEAQPELAKAIEQTKTPPVVAPGGALPDQPSSPMVDPVSKMSDYLSIVEQESGRPSSDKFRKDMTKTLQENAINAVKDGAFHSMGGDSKNPKIQAKMEAVREYLEPLGYKVGPVTHNAQAGVSSMTIEPATDVAKERLQRLKGEPVSKPETPPEPRRGIIGDMLTTGEVVQTSSGRPTTPFPKIALDTSRKTSMTLRKAEEWLQSNALAEAESRGDDFNATQFRNEKPGKMPKAVKDSMEEYMFGEQPAVVPSILKPLVPTKPTKEQLSRPAPPSATPSIKPLPIAGNSLRSIVLAQGGISAKSLRKDYSQKNLKSDGLLGVMRIAGQPLDELAQMLESSGDLRVPEGRTAADYLLEQLKANADGARAQYSDAEIEAQLEAERKLYDQRQEYEFEASVLDAIRKRSEEAATLAVDAGEEQFVPFTESEAAEIIDTSFDFGANVAVDDKFELKRPEKPKPKPADFGTNPNTKQGGLFDAGKKGDKKGQELLFNSDPGDLNNPRTQENKPKVEPPAQSQAEPSQEDLMEQILREELMGETPAETAKPTKAAKPKTKPKSGAIEVIESRGAKMERSKGLIKAGLMAVDDRVSFVDYTGKTLTGTITAVDSEDGNVRVSVDQVKKAGGVPIGRVLYKEAVDLTNLTQAKRTEPASKPKTKKTSKDTAKALDDAVIDFGKSFGTTANTGLSPDQMRATAKLVRAAIEHGTKTFEEFVEFVVKKFNATVALQAAEGIELAWRSLKRLPEYSGIDDPGKVADVLGQKTGWAAVPQHFANQLANGKSYKSITEARSEASEIVGSPVKPGTADAKALDEAIEYGIVQAGRMIVESGGTPGAIYDKLVDMYGRQPVLGVRNSTSMILQAYSTPVPLAWLVSNLGNVTADTKVYEPTAGNGMLLIGTDVKNAFANELDPDRAKILRDQGFNVTENDAANTASPEVDVVLANPPFGKVKDADRKTIEFDVDGFKTTEIDHAIALQSLKGMKPDGHTVLILAAKGHDAKTDLERRTAYSKGKDRPFYDALYQGYDVTEHFTVDGSLYSRQGASFPVDVIVLRPRGTVSMDQKRATPWAMVPRIFSNWGDLKNAFFNEMADSGSGTGVLSGNGDNRSSDLSTGNADDMGRIPRSNENTTAMAEGNVNASESESVVSTPVDGKTGGRRGSKKSGGSRSQSGLPTTAADKRGGKGNVSDASEAGTVSKGLDSGTRPDGMAGTSAAESEVDPESHQSAYEPSSKNKNVETLVPTNLQDAIRTALENVEDAHGPIDAFVQKELGYKPNDKFFNDLSAEQVDAIALAVHSHQRGAGMVVGDMTGVGKGRVAAAMMRYAERQGLVPVFITEKPDLFGDMYRDLSDIGSDSAEAPFFAQPTNDTAGSKAIDLPDGRKLKSSKETAIARIDEALISLKAGNGFKAMVDGVPTKINAVFTMYTQLQTVDGKETRRREQLRDLMPHAFLIMDESHNAGGTVKERVNENAPPDRAALAREFVQSSAGTMYLSATFAKRPDVMDLYSKTDMAKAVDGDITKLASVIQTGGLPLQQVLSAMLGESGQYIRREKSFAGIEFSKVDVGVNLDEQDKITGVFRGIRTLDGAINEIVTGMNDELVAAGEHGVAGDVSTGDAGMTSNSFSSILWNAVDQMLFALKADKAADNAIESWKNGETPILAVDNTMERIIDEYVEENELKVGDVVNLTFRNILHRYLERSRWITIDTGMRDERGKKINRKERLTDDQLNVETPIGNALTMFNAAYDAIEATNIDAPASPIDWMRHKMQKAGMKIAEITGRSTILVYSDAGVATLGARPKSEKGTRGKQETIRRINDGSLDGLLLNRSGATGVSIHASSKFKNQKVRHMMIVQPAKNIDEFMQMLGRVNRTGQVVKPRYSLLMSDSPAELRPAAVLSKKLASLNASVTAKSKGAVGFTVTDVMNQVGGAIVSQYLVDNPEFAMSLDMSMEELNDDTEVDTLEDVVRKATGRSSILPITQQREFWDDITAAYNARIEELNALNANPLIAQTMDLDARTLSSVNLFAGKPDDGPFAAPANIERMDVRNPGKPMTPNQVKGKIQEFYDITNIDDRHGAAIKWERATVESLQEEMPAFHTYAVKNLVNPEAVIARHSKLHEQTESVIEAINTFAPGTVIEYVMDGMPFSGVVIGFKRTGRTGNPSAPSRWMIEIAINDSARKLNVPVSRSSNLFVKNESIDSVLESFEYAQTQSREKRWMGTGNLVAAYAQLSARNGKLIFYTDDQGNTKRGILMPRAFDATSFLEGKAVQFKTSGDILTFFDSGGQRIVSADGNLIIVKPDDKIVFQAPRARQRGGKYTLNRGIIAAAQQDFVSVGNNMVLRSSNREQQRRILDAVLDVTALEARNDTDRDLARSILGITNEETPAGTPGTATPDPSEGSAEAPISDARKAANEAKEALYILRSKNARFVQIMQDEWANIVNSAPMLPLTDEMARALAGYTVGSIRAGIKRFDAFIKELRANLDEAAITHVKPNIIEVWNSLRPKYKLDEATDELFDAAMSNTVDVDIEKAVEAAKAAPPAESQNSEPPIAENSPGTPPEVPLNSPDPATQPTATGDGAVNSPDDSRTIPGRWTDSPDADEPTIGINKAKRAERRNELGLAQEDIVSKVGHSFPELDAEAKKVAPGEAEDVFTRIGAGGEAADNASDRDVFVMLNHYAGKLLATTETLNERKAAQEAGDDFRVVELDAKLNVQIAEEARLMAIAKNAGTAAGRALAAFKALMKYDMSLARLRMRLNAAADGNPTDAQNQEQIDLHAKYEAALKELEAKTKEAEEAIARAEIAEQIARRMKEKEKRDKAGGKVKTKADRRLDAALEKLGKDLSFFSFTGAFQKLPQLIELAGALIEKNMERFEDFVSWTSKRWGKTPKPETLPVLRQAWDTAWEQEKHRKPPSPPKVSVERDIPDSLVNAAKILFRHFLEEGITNTEEVIDAVHSELQDQFPNLITERLDTMKAMVDYEKTITLSQDPLDILAADKRAIVQLKAKIEDMQRGIAPRRSEQRYPASDEQRAHIKMFNEEKRKGGFEVTDPDRQAKSALASLETRLRHSISDTLNEIASGSRIVPNKTVAPTSDTTEDLQAYLALVRGMHKDIFGDRTMTQEQKIKAAEAAAVKNEAYWNDRLARAKSGDFSTGKAKPDPVTNANIAAIKARSELAKAQVAELKALANPKPSPEAISDARYLTSLQNQLSKKMDRMADIMARAAAGDFAPERNLSKEKREANADRRKKDAAIRDARIKLDETSRALNDQIENVRKKNLTYVDLAKRVPGALWATLRDAKLTGELSFILRQGGPRVFGTMVPAGKIARAGIEAITGNTDAAKLKLQQAGQGYKQLGATLGRTLKAAFWKTDSELARANDALKQRPNYINGTYDAMRLSLHEDGGKYSVAEELFINNLIELGQLALDKRFPGLKGFRDGHPVFTKVAHNLNLANRISNATKVFMNELRADMADDAAALWTMKSGEMTAAESRILGKTVNAFTGKGDMSLIGMDGQKAQSALSKVLISAPWLMSRLQLMALHPLWSKGSTGESRKAAAEIYVDMAAGVAAYYGAFVLAGMFMSDDDDERPVVEWDSTSSDFMKVRIGKTRLDPLFGLQQVIVLTSRILHDEIKDSHGVVRPRKGFEDDWALISRFQEGRLHPAIQDIRSLKTGQDFMGNPITKTEVAIGAITPITYPDIVKASENRGVPASTAIAIWAMAGGGLATYDPRTKARADIVEELGIIQRKIKNQNTPADVRKSLQTDADKMLEEHLLNAVKHDMSYLGNTVVSEQLATREPGTPIAPELTEAIQKEKHDITLRALEMLSTEDTKKAKKPGEDNGITTARSLLRTMAPTYDEANALFEAAYKQRNGSLRELVGEKGHKRWQFKTSVTAARRRMKAIYATK